MIVMLFKLHRHVQVWSILAITALSASAQIADHPSPAPDDISLQFKLEGGQQQYHLGELIPMTYSYSVKTPDKYFWVMNNRKLAGGRPITIACSPPVESTRERESDDSAFKTFEEMLVAGCGGAGVGGGVGGGCGDCDGEVPLGRTPLGFGVIPLNEYVRFRIPGTYTCEASSAEISATPRGEKNRPALLVKSKPILLTIVDDPAWAHSVGGTYADAYEKRCGGNDVAERKFLECSDLARRITYLDTTESLATEVKEYDGRNHGWNNGFWDAIRTSSYQPEAVRLMSLRMQQPDFEASTWVLEWVAISELKMETPDAFVNNTPNSYHGLAVEKLRKYVRLLGDSLARKEPVVLGESRKTYRYFAERQFCGEALVPTEERNRALHPDNQP